MGTGMASTKGRQALMKAVTGLDRNFSFNQSNANAKFLNALAAYQGGKSVQSPKQLISTFQSNLKDLGTLSNSIPRADNTILNTPIIKLESTGSPIVSQMKLALQSARLQYASIEMQGGVPKKELAQKVQEAFPDEMTPNQVTQNINLLLHFSAVRAAGLQNQLPIQDVNFQTGKSMGGNLNPQNQSPQSPPAQQGQTPNILMNGQPHYIDPSKLQDALKIPGVSPIQ